jgi:hypothetical protein
LFKKGGSSCAAQTSGNPKEAQQDAGVVVRNAYKRWSVEEDAFLVGLVSERVKISDIAERMGRTRLAILQRIGRLHDEGLMGGFL